jgi:hypothetical protein
MATYDYYEQKSPGRSAGEIATRTGLYTAAGLGGAGILNETVGRAYKANTQHGINKIKEKAIANTKGSRSFKRYDRYAKKLDKNTKSFSLGSALKADKMKRRARENVMKSVGSAGQIRNFNQTRLHQNKLDKGVMKNSRVDIKKFKKGRGRLGNLGNVAAVAASVYGAHRASNYLTGKDQQQ